MIVKPTAKLDKRNVEEIVDQLLARRPGYVPEWLPQDKGADVALSWITARYLYSIIQRLNQAPEKNKLGFLDLLGLALVPAQAARTPIVFQLAADGADAQAPANTQLAAPPPPGSKDQLIFETERASGLAAAQLKQVVSLWPGRDQYLDHSNSFIAGQPFQLFRKPLLLDTPHVIYLAHDRILAFAGKASVEVEFELTQASARQLGILWQYWDGKVWRGFKSVRAACSEKEFAHADSTVGFTRSGKFSLEADCAETAKTEVNGTKAFWVRGQLTEILPPDSSQALPLVESVRLLTVIDQSLRAGLTPVINKEKDDPSPTPGKSELYGSLTNEAGTLLPGIELKITDPTDPNFHQVILSTKTGNNAGKYDTNSELESRSNYEIEASFLTLEGACKLKDLEAERKLEVDLTFNVIGLDPDKAFANGTKLDVTKPFYPFGQEPAQPGSTFYFTQQEVFSKPGAHVQVYVARTESPQDLIDITSTPNAGLELGATTISLEEADNSLQHLLAWEYWNGRRWVTMFQSTSFPNSKDLETTEIIEFDVPFDFEPVKVNDQEGLWVRVRLVSGGFGFKQTVPWEAGGASNKFTYVINQPPALAAFRLGYTWRSASEPAEQVRTFNDFQYEDHTYDAKWPGVTFSPFRSVTDVTPALYLGFDKKLPVDDIGIYFDIVEEKGETGGPALLWEYFDGSSWHSLSFEDETRNLRLPGILSLIAAEDSKPLARFGTELHFIRGRLKEDGPPGEPEINGIFPNSVWASQQRTLNDTPLGASSGLPNQVFRFTQIPVLPGQRIEVRELAGGRANVEWRILAMQISDGDANIIRELEEMLGREGNQTDLINGDLRLRRDKNKKVVEVWVRWKEQAHFFDSRADDRDYVMDHARGLVFFGDGLRGRIPPPKSAILAKQHRSGGGLAGNVPARSIKQLLGPISGVQGVFNPRAAEGGADGETVERFSLRGPRTLRHRGRAISPSDYETLAREASPAVAVARAIPTRNASGLTISGWVTLVIIPQSEERLPWPSFGLRQQVLKYIEDRAPADVVAANHIYLTGPNYLAIDVRARLAPKNADEAGTVEKRARQALEDFLHPLRGGPEHLGWDTGRDLYVSDLSAVLERVEGIDYVKELSLSVDDILQAERVEVADDRVIVAGKIRLSLQAAER
ncbi:MAG TPA: putative baseplate assembly protein [Pyrinomonadaceae bacterium]|nr:putative baseplate assembly protein [Pyrinomonadaceae bacterium]